MLTNNSPESLTPNQEKLLSLLYDTETTAPVGRRRQRPDGGFELYKFERLTRPIDFAQEGEFAFKHHEKRPDAPLSPIAINLRNLPANLLEQIAMVMTEIPLLGIPTGQPDFITGIPAAGVPIAKAYGKKVGLPVIEILAKKKTEKGRQIIGIKDLNSSNFKVRVVDDLATEGETKLEALHAVEQLGHKVTDVVVLVDRQQGARNFLREEGYKLHAALTIDQILRYGLRTSRITLEQYKQSVKYLDLR